MNTLLRFTLIGLISFTITACATDPSVVEVQLPDDFVDTLQPDEPDVNTNENEDNVNSNGTPPSNDSESSEPSQETPSGHETENNEESEGEEPSVEPENPNASCSFDFTNLSPLAVALEDDLENNFNSVFEPSGALWHSEQDLLFVVDDESNLVSLNSAGVVDNYWSIPGGLDLEGITVANPSGDLVYLGEENPNVIHEFDLVSGTILRSFSIPTAQMPFVANNGLEALTFVPDIDHPEGGLFYVGHQDDGEIHVFELPIQTSTTSTTVTHIDSFFAVANRDDIASLTYHEDSETVFAVYDGWNRLTEMETDGTFIQEWALFGNNQEGFAIGPNCEMYIAEDDGDIKKYEE